MGHGHGHALDDWTLPGVTRRRLNAAVLVCIGATVLGLVVLWPRGPSPQVGGDPLGFSPLLNATVETADLSPCSFSSAQQTFTCNHVVVTITSGPTKGDTVNLELPLNAGIPTVQDGDRIRLNYEADAPAGNQYQFADFQRGRPLAVLALLFAAVVIALGRFRGLMALAGLALSLVVLLVFVLPSLLRGHDPVFVAIVGASAVAILALYLAHGVNTRTTVALLGSFAALLLTAGLAELFVAGAHFTGLSAEEAGFLQLTAGQVNLKGLLLAGIVIGSLGVLDDVTVTQVSAVWEVHQADPSMSHRGLYRAGVRVGRDHIASTVNTLVLAYAGAALPLLLLFFEAKRPLGTVITTEAVAVEVVRTLVGSIGLVAAVPITTALAAAVIPPETTARAGPGRDQSKRPRRPGMEATAGDDADWEDFTPEAKPGF